MERQLTYKYTHNGLICAINIFNFPEDYSSRPRLRTLAFRYLFQYNHIIPRLCPTNTQIVKQAKSMFQEMLRSRRDRQHAYEIADILSTFAPEHGNILLNRIRAIEEEENEPVIRQIREEQPRLRRTTRKQDRTVYSDTQNVHNTKINQSVLHTAKTLQEMYKDLIGIDLLENIRTILLQKFSADSKTITNSLKYIQESTATFGIGITLQDTFKAVWLWIHDKNTIEQIHELEKRLVEEIKEMHGFCTTGHLARLVNVIQGFTDDENLIIKISDTDQYKAVIKNYLTKKLQECKDPEVIDGMTEADEKYIKYIRGCIKDKLLEWTDEYGKDILKKLPSIINEFSNAKVYKV